MGSKPSRKAGRKTGRQEDGQEDEQDDEDDVAKYTIPNDWFKPKHYAKTHDSNPRDRKSVV